MVGTHGALAEEQERPQPFEVDLDLAADLSAAGASDDLPDTIDYGAVVGAVQGIVATEHHQLLERVATRIVDDVFALDDRITAIRVTVRKLRPPVPVDVVSAGVTLTRTRP